MGDSGSYFLGFVLATCSLIGAQKASTTVSLLVPIVALGLPIFDTLFSMFRRMVERRPIFSPDRGHIHHRLLDMGITHRRAVMILYGVCVVLTVAAIGISLGRSWEVGLALFAATVVMIALVRFAGYFEYLNLRRKQRLHLYDAHTERLRWLLPELPKRLNAVHDEAGLREELDRLVAQAQLARIELLAQGGKGSECVLVSEAASDVSRSRDLASAQYPLRLDGDMLGELAFSWRSDAGQASPQMDILLQIVADLVARRLGSLKLESANGAAAQARESGEMAALRGKIAPDSSAFAPPVVAPVTVHRARPRIAKGS
jgi:UDP-GlcNAc:undecaprenyl-phosphate GlcNAc-1-phosphate transferase